MRARDGRRHLVMGDPGDLFMQKEIQKIGIVFLPYLFTLTRAGLKMRLLIVVVSKKEFEYNGKVIPSVTHQFDTGAAWENLALEATSRDLVAHGIAGFEYDKARKDLDVPDGSVVVSMIAIGKRGPKENLLLGLQEREIRSDRKPLEEIVMEGHFKQDRN